MGFAMVGKTMWNLRMRSAPGNAMRSPKTAAIYPFPWRWYLAVSTAGFVALVYFLVPDYPWWISAFGFVWTPISYIGARMIGLTGSPPNVSFPYLREGSFYLSGYQGAAVVCAYSLCNWGYEAPPSNC